MIIEKLYFLSEKEKKIALLLTLSCYFLTALLIIIIINSYKNKDTASQECAFISVFVFIVSILGGIGVLLDIILKLLKWQKSIGQCMVRYFLYKRRRAQLLVAPRKPNKTQIDVCESIIDDNENAGLGTFVHIYGHPNKGKTTAAFLILQDIFLKGTGHFSNIKEIVLIDCSVDRNKILEFFDPENDRYIRNNGRTNKFRDCIVIVDNVEALGIDVITKNKSLFKSRHNLFIIIEDNDSGETIIPKSTFNENQQRQFIEDIGTYKSCLKCINNLTRNEKNIFFSIYFAIFLRKYARIEFIAEILNYPPKDIINFVKKHQKEVNIFSIFPFNRDYIYCIDPYLLKKIPEKFGKYTCYQKIAYLYRICPSLDMEEKWLSMIQLDLDEIIQISPNQRLMLFDGALKKGRYQLMYETLNRSLTALNVRCLNLFIYENGVLNYHMGNHKKAAELYDDYLNSLSADESSKAKAYARIIECSHGSSSSKIMRKVEDYIIKLSDIDNFKPYADFWRNHIDTEKGIFNIDILKKTCMDIQKLSTKDGLYQETLKRSYTDLLRCYHILAQYPPENIELEFKSHLGKPGHPRYDYYTNIYLDAHKKHYLDIPLERTNKNRDILIQEPTFNKQVQHSVPQRGICIPGISEV